MQKLVRISAVALALGIMGGLNFLNPVHPAAVAVAHPGHPHYHYVCPMGHEDSDKPGKCSVCGMTLKKVEQTF